jgi:hypothetical protein
MRFWVWRWDFFDLKVAQAINPIDLIINFLWPYNTSQSEFSIKNYDRLKLKWSDFDFDFCRLSSSFFLSSFSLCLSSLFLYMKSRWQRVDNPWDSNFWIYFRVLLVTLVRANIIDQSKCQSKCQTQKATQPFNNGFLKEPLLNTAFNNGFGHRTVVKWCV